MTTAITRDITDFVTRPLLAGQFQGCHFDSGAVGSITPSTGQFTTLTRPTVAITGGSINGTTVGASVSSTGKFTNFTVTSSATATGATMVDMDFSTYFPTVTGGTGYIKLPNGIYFQWITGALDPADNTEPVQILNWAIAFPNIVFSTFVTMQLTSAATSADMFYQTFSPTKTTVSVQRQHGPGTPFTVTSKPVVFGVGA